MTDKIREAFETTLDAMRVFERLYDGDDGCALLGLVISNAERALEETTPRTPPFQITDDVAENLRMVLRDVHGEINRSGFRAGLAPHTLVHISAETIALIGAALDGTIVVEPSRARLEVSLGEIESTCLGYGMRDGESVVEFLFRSLDDVKALEDVAQLPIIDK